MRAPLPPGRAALLSAETVARRAALLTVFVSTIGEDEWRRLQQDASGLSRTLEQYGRDLHADDKSLHDYADLILAVQDSQRDLRGRLTVAWDLYSLWKATEPATNRTAIPVVAWMALCALSLLWGWPRFASLCGLGYAALLRPLEWFRAQRRHLTLPQDAGIGLWRCWLRILDPKTRWRAARHTVARCDEVWVTQLLEQVFQHTPAEEALWPASPNSFRRRWDVVCQALQLPHAGPGGITPGCLRPGGATALHELTEDVDWLRRRGRWRNASTLEIYVQEVVPWEFLARQSPAVLARLRVLANMLPDIVDMAIVLMQQNVPKTEWYNRFLIADSGK